MYIQFNSISKSFNGITIFENISGKINEGDKIGLIGANGVGKTTLLRIICGREEYDTGSILRSQEGIFVTYFEQNVQFAGDKTVYEEVYDQIFNENSCDSFQELQTKTRTLLFSIGLKERDFGKKLCELSGGEKTKLFLSKALALKTDVLILDEPTNHLDMNSIKWLENFISKLSIAVVMVSHDRQFLDNTVAKIFEMNKNGLKEYAGNYSDFRRQREVEIITMRKLYEKETREIKHLKEIIAQRMIWFSKTEHKPGSGIDYLSWKDKSGNQARVIKSKEIKLARLEENRVEKPKEESIDIFDIVNRRFIEHRLPKYIIEIKNVTKNYDSAEIFVNASFQIKNGEKAAILGDNGSGKTTLLRLLLGIEKTTKGDIYINPSVRIGYFSQNLEILDESRTLLEEFTQQGISKQDARSVLPAILFDGDSINKKIRVLSMGERCRAALGKLILFQPDVLLLDEPTNFMDIASRENFESVIAQFKGTVILVTHDRYFINKFAERIISIEDKKIKAYEGGYQYYLEKRNNEKKELTFGKGFRKTADDIILLECKLALLSAQLGDDRLDEEQRKTATDEFFELSARLREKRSQTRSSSPKR